jgi:hypothetical protein
VVREPEFTPEDVALLIASRREENIPRNEYGIPMSEATDPRNNPYDPRATGWFEPIPYADFAKASVETAAEARRRAIPEGDWPLTWVVEKRDR